MNHNQYAMTPAGIYDKICEIGHGEVEKCLALKEEL